jgi:class 3 adenylate cyclase
MADYLGTDQARALISLASTDYIMATEVLGALVFGTGREESRDHGAFIRACADPELFSRVLDLLPVDASLAAAELTVPTLVLHHRDLTYVTDAMTRELGALIPTSRVSLVDGRWADNPVGLAARIAAFINDSPVGETGVPEAGASPALAPGTAVILFADIADSTALTEQMGDAAFRERSRLLDDGIRAAVRAAGGTPVEGRVLGDGVMGVFTSAALAIEAALRCLELGVATDLQLHVGLHAGDVLREKHNVYGGAVNIASRICGLSDRGEILVSQTVRELARTSTPVAFEDRGEHALKGVADPVRVFAVRA